MKYHEIMKPIQLIKGWTYSCFIFLHVEPLMGGWGYVSPDYRAHAIGACDGFGE